VQKRWPWRKHLRNGTDWLEAEPTASWLRSHATPPPSRSSALPPAAATSAAERMTRAQWTARVSAWYVERARAIDVLSGQLHHATDLLKLGIGPRKVRATHGVHLPGRGSPFPRRCRDWARRCQIGAATDDPHRVASRCASRRRRSRHFLGLAHDAAPPVPSRLFRSLSAHPRPPPLPARLGLSRVRPRLLALSISNACGTDAALQTDSLPCGRCRG
jgi:hypothetical protein